MAETEIDQLIIARSFGTFIDVGSAVILERLPTLPIERFSQMGNAAGTGARSALVSLTQPARAAEIVGLDGYIELASVTNFQRKFAEATYL